MIVFERIKRPPFGGRFLNLRQDTVCSDYLDVVAEDRIFHSPLSFLVRVYSLQHSFSVTVSSSVLTTIIFPFMVLIDIVSGS